MRKIFLIFLSVLFLLIMFTGCAASNKPSGADTTDTGTVTTVPSESTNSSIEWYEESGVEEHLFALPAEIQSVERDNDGFQKMQNLLAKHSHGKKLSTSENKFLEDYFKKTTGAVLDNQFFYHSPNEMYCYAWSNDTVVKDYHKISNGIVLRENIYLSHDGMQSISIQCGKKVEALSAVGGIRVYCDVVIQHNLFGTYSGKIIAHYSDIGSSYGIIAFSEDYENATEITDKFLNTFKQKNDNGFSDGEFVWE